MSTYDKMTLDGRHEQDWIFGRQVLTPVNKSLNCLEFPALKGAENC